MSNHKPNARLMLAGTILMHSSSIIPQNKPLIGFVVTLTLLPLVLLADIFVILIIIISAVDMKSYDLHSPCCCPERLSEDCGNNMSWQVKRAVKCLGYFSVVISASLMSRSCSASLKHTKTSRLGLKQVRLAILSHQSITISIRDI